MLVVLDEYIRECLAIEVERTFRGADVVQSFNGRLRAELLWSETFETLAEAKYLVDRWRLRYNHRRPQRALGKVSPAAYAASYAAASPLRLAPLACAASPQHGEFPSSMHQLS